MMARATGRPRSAALTIDCGVPPTATRIGNALDRGPELSGPLDRALSVTNLDQEVQLLGEQLVVVLEVETKQWEGLDEGAPADQQLRPAVTDGVERRVLLIHPDRVIGAEDRHSRK
jgi:hypothetical protein